MLTLSEKFVRITMASTDGGGGGPGNKGYEYPNGAVHQIDTYTVRDIRSTNYSQPVGSSQSSLPQSTLLGKKLESVVLNIRLGNSAEVQALCTNAASSRSNGCTPKNLFVAGSILAISGASHPELTSATYWYVESWSTRMGTGQRIMVGDLALLEWNQPVS